MTISVQKVDSVAGLKTFVNFPFSLYKGNRYWCPPLKFDEINTLRKEKNPAFEICESEYWIAYKNGQIAGRIAGIINRREKELWDVKLVRFGWIDFIDDPEVSAALIKTVEEWGKSKGMEGIHGPLGFNDMDPEGMLVEGFEQMSGISTIYNHPYYADHMVRLGFRKAVDWLQMEVKVPVKIPEKILRMNSLVMEKYSLHLLRAKRSKDLIPYARKLFHVYNDSFRDLYGFIPLTEAQMDFYTRQYFSFLDPSFVSMVLDSRDEPLAFGISMPAMGKALQKAGGSLFPFGFFHLLRAMKSNDTVHMMLVGVRPGYREKGVLAPVFCELTGNYIRKGYKTAVTHMMLEENSGVLSIWKNYENSVVARRRCWVKDF
jgi:hypothetical protein